MRDSKTYPHIRPTRSAHPGAWPIGSSTLRGSHDDTAPGAGARVNPRIHRCAAALVFLITTPVASLSQPPPEAPDTAIVSSVETYRLRVENAEYGRIELSVDGGEHFMLVGRVIKAATAAAPEPASRPACSIVRGSGDGLAFTVAQGQVLKLLPAPAGRSGAKAPDCAMVTDLRPRTGLLGDYCPPAGTDLLQQVGHGPLRPYPDGLTPSEDTVFAFRVTLPSVLGPSAVARTGAPDAAALARLAECRKGLAELAHEYAERSVERARDARRSVVSGVVALRARLPAGEPEPIAAVTYSIDGDVVSAQNVFPSTYGWDTTKLPNGEHVIEIRALSKHATVVTRVRALVLVMNRLPDAPSIDKARHIQ